MSFFMVEPRIKTKIWVQAFLKKISILGHSATIINHGDDDSGSVLIKINNLKDCCNVFTQIRGDDGALQWLSGTGGEMVTEDIADQYIVRQKKYDGDLWAIEVEDPNLSFTLENIVK